MSTINLTATLTHESKTVGSGAPVPGSKTKLTMTSTGQPANIQVVETTGPPVVYQNVPPGPCSIVAQQLAPDNATAFGPPWSWSYTLEPDVTIIVLTGVTVEVTRV